MSSFNSKKPSFFERLTGGVRLEEEERASAPQSPLIMKSDQTERGTVGEENEEEGELAVDVYQTPDSIIVKAMIAGVKPDDLDVSISRDMVTLRGKRGEDREVFGDDYFFRELYWGSFSRTILLPEEVEPEEAEATEKNGLLTIRLPKIDKKKIAKLKVRSS